MIRSSSNLESAIHEPAQSGSDGREDARTGFHEFGLLSSTRSTLRLFHMTTVLAHNSLSILASRRFLTLQTIGSHLVLKSHNNIFVLKMQSRSLSDFEIDQYFKGDQRYGGCVSKDHLMDKSPSGKFWIVNLQSEFEGNQRGTHWVLVCDVAIPDSNEDLCIYYDPYGISPQPIIEAFMSRSDKRGVYTDDQYQALESTNCGYYCIFVAQAILASIPYDQIFNQILKEDDFKDNEALASKITLHNPNKPKPKKKKSKN